MTMNSICTPSIDSRYEYNTDVEEYAKNIELTLAIIKPSAYQHAILIEKCIKNEGFAVIKKRSIHLSPEQASDFYFEHYGKSTFPAKILALSQGPCVVLCLAKANAVEDLKRIFGPYEVERAMKLYPDSLRAKFGDLLSEQNGLHCSDSIINAEQEIHYFFPDIISSICTSPEDTNMCKKSNDINDVYEDNKKTVIFQEKHDHSFFETEKCTDSRTDYLTVKLNPILKIGLAELCRKKPTDPLLWLASWLLDNNPNKPHLRPELHEIPT